MSGIPGVFVLYSSFTDPPSTDFQGYCFVGADYVFGPQGAAMYASQSGTAIGPGEDGCYISVRCTAPGVCEFGADAAGNAKIFYYSENGIWAVANSLIRLVEHLRENGVALTPNSAQLHALSWGITFTRQISSFATAFEQIRLLPSDRTLILARNGLREADPENNRPALSYPDALRYFVDIWSARFATLFMDGRIEVSIDLTGGVDSRAIFALAKSGMARAGTNASRAIFKSATGPRWKKDLRVASRLAARYGVEVNPDLKPAMERLGNWGRYSRWREVCLGVYLPIYLHDTVVDPFTIHINGGGGENHRHFYPPLPAERYLDEQRDQAPEHLYGRWRDETDAALSYLTARNDSADALILHYREFRNRFHTGRPPLYRTGFAPLTTTLFHQSTVSGGITHAGQLNFDIMESLIPGLKDFPYDDPAKAPSDDNVRNLTIVDADFGPPEGRVYADNSLPTTQRVWGPGPVKAMRLVGEAAAQALQNEEARKLAGSALVKRVSKFLDAATVAGKFDHATSAKELSFLLAADFAFRD